ncbi:MAG TPA: DNA mismatch repair endonuclease MutL [Chthonomonadaceae bacterium]|nr:DNA mismatch repair endonuclease MutL [Chthonomonadaceae bacterium]
MATDRIVLLDENTANRIAAGEVVERPASAVKELLENAIDAGAAQIVIGLEEGGKQRLVVADNGFGMTRADAVLALQRHATSKIRTADDLFAIHTLGFRGEALPSIASVSRLTLTTKPPDEESGTRLLVVGGDIESAEEIAARDGTTIEVADLFFNTPARLKFLKSTPTEMARVIEVVGQLAVAYPGIAFRLRNGSQEVFSTPGTGEPLAALAAVWGRDIARKLIPVRHETAGLVVSGYIATPDVSRPGRSHELFFVNRRPIRSRLLGHALEEAFRVLTPDSRYPIAALFVEINPDLVDVNVHPTKTEVKFTRDGEVHHAASQAIKSALLAYGIVPTARPTATEPPMPLPSPQKTLEWRQEPESRPIAPLEIRPASETSSSAFDPIVEAAGARMPAPPLSTAGPPDPFAAEASELPTPSPESDRLEEPLRPHPFAEQLRNYRVLGQARNTYIVALTNEGLAVIDQHVAHERVLYERLTVKRFSQGIPSQRLAVPLTINLSRREALLLAEHCGSFAAAGWEISPFGRESFVVRAIPAVLTGKPYEQILRDMIDELVNQTISRRLLVQQDHVTITNACKMAVKAGDPLTIPEMEGLLEQLAETENPYLCPHGRPIVVTISFAELDKQFKRA